ncbi:hypothetical protein HY522_04600 [bacterium]|nr:hypothetical protein [bacterium]
MKRLYYDTVESPVGKIVIAVSARGIIEIHYPLKGPVETFVKRYAGPPLSLHPVPIQNQDGPGEAATAELFQA